ncbi:MAG TPA: hypothetical protein PKN62_02605 [bacterium]|nr:hypothetical protein [bacterium]
MINNNSFDQEIVKKIKDKNIEPRPRWWFSARNSGIWLAGLIALFLGSISTALIIYLSTGNDISIHRLAGASSLDLLLLSVPFFWLAISAVFVYLAYVNLKNTDHGYKYSPWLIASSLLGASFILGGVLYTAGFGKTIDEMLGKKMPFYEYLANPRVGFWMQENKGRLSGVVLEKINDKKVILADHNRKIWLVDISKMKQPKDAPKIFIDNLIGQPVGFFGDKKGEAEFGAKGIFPFPGGSGFFDHARKIDDNQRRPLPPEWR